MFDRPNATHYEILGVKPDVSTKEIRAAYEKMAMLYHPDKASKNGLTNEQATAYFKKINEAHQTLSIPLRRIKYDALNVHSNERKDPSPKP